MTELASRFAIFKPFTPGEDRLVKQLHGSRGRAVRRDFCIRESDKTVVFRVWEQRQRELAMLRGNQKKEPR